MKYVVPEYKQHMSSDELVFSEELEDFYQRHEKVIYYAVGTQWNHKNHTLHEIVKLA